MKSLVNESGAALPMRSETAKELDQTEPVGQIEQHRDQSDDESDQPGETTIPQLLRSDLSYPSSCSSQTPG
jgi:hypothetical protein